MPTQQKTPKKAPTSPSEAPKRVGMGRPTTYDPEVATKIIQQLSDGIPLREICRQEGMPPWRTMYDWMGRNAELSAHIARARELGYEAIAEETLAIADDATNDYVDRVIDGDGRTRRVLDVEHVQRSKLRIETRLKLLAKWNPKKYGDKVVVGGDPEAPLKTEVKLDVLQSVIDHLLLTRQTEAKS